MLRHKQGPGIFAWALAAISLALPWIGAGFCLVGLLGLARGESDSWWLLAAGMAIIVADVVLDFVWAHPSISVSDQPELNQRTAQLVGRVLVVEEAIAAGRGKVRAGDTLWPAEGPDTPRGAEVKVVAAKATVLHVERVDT